jgi:hypothetical protein
MREKNRVEDWFEHRRFVLDLAGLNEQERAEGSTLLGGSGSEFISRGDSFEYNQVKLVVFNWGDKAVNNVIANLLEHEDTPSDEYIPFSLSTIMGNQVWSLTIQNAGFVPSEVYSNKAFYWIIPFDAVKGLESLDDFLSRPTPRGADLLAKVGLRWVAFEMGTDIR